MINFLVEMYCGQETSENCSYFVSSGTVNSGECRLKICPCNDNICQLRLDFQTFVLNQPDTCRVIFQFILWRSKNTYSILSKLFQRQHLLPKKAVKVFTKKDNVKLISLVSLLLEIMHLQLSVVQILVNIVSNILCCSF